ncbi:MAG: hypothetical protein Q9157_005745 [Trypethelium eluteriae]
MADLPSPPFITVPGIANFRDIGGTPISTSTKVSSGVLFRSADPSNVTQAGLVKLKDLGVTHYFDLRSTIEIERDAWNAGQSADPETGVEGTRKIGIKRYWAPVFAGDDYSPEKIALRYRQYAREGTEGFSHAYADILRAGAPSFSNIFMHLANVPSPCLIHCTAGKDRTGVFVALLLSLLGCSDETVAGEYALTEQGLAEKKSIFLARLLQTEALKGDQEGAENMVGARAANMLATLVMLREEYGSVEDYLKNMCNLTDRDIRNIRARFIH